MILNCIEETNWNENCVSLIKYWMVWTHSICPSSESEQESQSHTNGWKLWAYNQRVDWNIITLKISLCRRCGLSIVKNVRKLGTLHYLLLVGFAFFLSVCPSLEVFHKVLKCFCVNFPISRLEHSPRRRCLLFIEMSRW